MGSEQVLLDATDRTRRMMQHGAILAGVVVLIFARAFVDRPGGIALTLGMIAAGLALFGVAAAIKQRWAVTYKGHDVRFENNPFVGEKLFIDGTLARKGKLGRRNELRGVITGGDGAGHTIIARSVAGLITFSCRITAEAPDSGAVPPTVSDEQLLAELRRRRLTAD